MIARLLFKAKTLQKKKEFLEQHGEIIGTRFDGDKTLYLYMVKEFFVEIEYKDDNQKGEIKDLKIFANHNSLKKHLAQIP